MYLIFNWPHDRQRLSKKLSTEDSIKENTDAFNIRNRKSLTNK